MIKKLLLITSLTISTSLWASPMDKVCLINTNETGFINQLDYNFIEFNCERNNIIKFQYLFSSVVPSLISSFCRFDRNVNVNPVQGGEVLSCVLYSNRPREYIRAK